jgi:hypothetical protein
VRTNDSERSRWKRQWDEEGWLLVRGVFATERAERLHGIIEDILGQWRACDPISGKAADPDAHAMRHYIHPSYYRAHPEWFPTIIDAVTDPNIYDVARTIFGEDPLFRCTSVYFNPLKTSSEGMWHRDSQFIATSEAEEKEMVLKHAGFAEGVQIQVALVPSEDLEYVPCSHTRWDTPEEYAIRCADGGKQCRSANMPGAIRVRQQPGDAVLFNANGLHRGRYHTDKLRRAFMLTFTTRSRPHFDQLAMQPWLLEPGYIERMSAEARAFFTPFIATYRDYWTGQARAAAGP